MQAACIKAAVLASLPLNSAVKEGKNKKIKKWQNTAVCWWSVVLRVPLLRSQEEIYFNLPSVREIDLTQNRQEHDIFKIFVHLHLIGLSPLPRSASTQSYWYAIKYISQIRKNIKHKRIVHVVNFIKLVQKDVDPEINQIQAATNTGASETNWTKQEKKGGGQGVAEWDTALKKLLKEDQKMKQLATGSPGKTIHSIEYMPLNGWKKSLCWVFSLKENYNFICKQTVKQF